MPGSRGDHATRRRAPGEPAAVRISDLAATTPAHRDRYVDLLRAGAILVVVVGHWVVIAVTATDGRLGWVSLLTVQPWTHPLTWLVQVMPVVFLVGGYANAASWAAHHGRGGGAAAWVRGRALRLLRPTAAFLTVLLAGHLTATALGVEASVTATAVAAAASSLWFLVVYLAVVGVAPVLLAADRRWGLAAAAVAAGVVGAGDAARLLTGAASAGAASYLVAWAAMHQLGVAWHAGRLTRDRRPAVALLAGGFAALLLMTVPGPYGVTMVGGAPPPELTNTAPPTLALLALACAQTGVVLLLRGAADRWLARRRVWLAVVAVNAVALTVYLWHLVPVVVAGHALVVTGVFPQPDIGSAGWWVLRVPWLALLAVLLLGIVAVTARWERRTSSAAGAEASAWAVGTGVVACLAGLAGLGVGGPDGVLPPIASLPVGELVVFAGGLVLLTRAATARASAAPPGSGRAPASSPARGRRGSAPS